MFFFFYISRNQFATIRKGFAILCDSTETALLMRCECNKTVLRLRCKLVGRGVAVKFAKVIEQHKSKQSLNTQINDLENDSNNLVELAQNFNKFFCSIGENLAKNLPCKYYRKFMTYLKNRNLSSMFLEAPIPYKIIDPLNSLSVNKVVGLDNIPAFVIKTANLYSFLTSLYLIIILFQVGFSQIF